MALSSRAAALDKALSRVRRQSSFSGAIKSEREIATYLAYNYPTLYASGLRSSKAVKEAFGSDTVRVVMWRQDYLPPDKKVKVGETYRSSPSNWAELCKVLLSIHKKTRWQALLTEVVLWIRAGADFERRGREGWWYYDPMRWVPSGEFDYKTGRRAKPPITVAQYLGKRHGILATARSPSYQEASAKCLRKKANAFARKGVPIPSPLRMSIVTDARDDDVDAFFDRAPIESLDVSMDLDEREERIPAENVTSPPQLPMDLDEVEKEEDASGQSLASSTLVAMDLDEDKDVARGDVETVWPMPGVAMASSDSSPSQGCELSPPQLYNPPIPGSSLFDSSRDLPMIGTLSVQVEHLDEIVSPSPVAAKTYNEGDVDMTDEMEVVEILASLSNARAQA